MTESTLALPGNPLLPLLQGWYPSGSDLLPEAWTRAGGTGMLRLPAFPDPQELRVRLRKLKENASGSFGLDMKGVLGHFREVLEAAVEEKAAFLLHGPSLPEGLREALQGFSLPRFAVVSSEEEARAAMDDRPQGLILEESALGRWVDEFRQSCSIPLLATLDRYRADWKEMLDRGFSGFRVRSPQAVREGDGILGELRRRLLPASDLMDSSSDPLPRLRIRHLDLPYPIVQGGMGVGVSWAHLAGGAARQGCVGLVSALGTAWAHPEDVEFLQGRPLPSGLNSGPNLARILREAREIAQGHGAVGVNILCAIRGYEQVVRDAVEAGAQLVVSGAGLPMTLPELTAGHDTALVPIVSSARALRLLCKTWERRYQRLPDAVVLEGPESGGHQGYSLEQCTDPAFSLEALLPDVLAERDAWGTFPVIVAGGIWDHGDIRRFLAMGAGGVQIGTRFIGTFECDADPVYKEVVLRSRPQDIQLMKSPVGMPARAVKSRLTEDLASGSAPKVCCISKCLTPCENGKGAHAAGYCIADRLADSRAGKADTGLFFTGSNGWRLQDMVSVRELVEDLTQDYGLERLDN